MRMSDNLAEKILRDSHLISPVQLNELKAEVRATHVPLADLALSRQVISEEQFTKAFAEELELPFAKLPLSDLPPAYLRLLPERIARRYRAIVFDVADNDTKSVAIDSPLSPEVSEMLPKLLGDNYKLFIAPSSHIHSALDTYRHLNVNHSEVVNRTVEQPGVEIKDNPAIYKTLHYIIEKAIENRASVIHIEPSDQFVLVRFRVNGQLKLAYKLPIALLSPLVNRIKLASGLISGLKIIQEGRFRLESQGQTYSVDAFILPLADGEKATLQLHNESAVPLPLAKTGLWGKQLEVIEHSLTARNGLVIVTGPKDSDKTATLYSLLTELGVADLNTFTVENRQSYKVAGASQIEVGAGTPTYDQALTACLKQDPEVVLAGESLNHLNLAKLADASENCLILTSANSSDSLSCLNELSQFGVPLHLLAYRTNLIIGQRLVRHLCNHCKQAVHPTNDTLKQLVQILTSAGHNIKALHSLEQQARNGRTGDLSTTATGIQRLWQVSSKGCVHCNYTGFSGRLAIYEVLELTDDIKAKLVAGQIEQARKLAVKSGFIPISIDGLVKALIGQTTIQEVLNAVSN